MRPQRGGTWVARRSRCPADLLSATSSYRSLSVIARARCGGANPSVSDFEQEARRTRASRRLSATAPDGEGTAAGTGFKPTGDLAACAPQLATAEARPVYLVFMFDKSGSMVVERAPRSGARRRPRRRRSSSRPTPRAFTRRSRSFPTSPTSRATSGPYAAPQVVDVGLAEHRVRRALDARPRRRNADVRRARGRAIIRETSRRQGRTARSRSFSSPTACRIRLQRQLCRVRCAGSASVASASIPTYVIGVGNELAARRHRGGRRHEGRVHREHRAIRSRSSRTFSKRFNDHSLGARVRLRDPRVARGENLDRGKVNVIHRADGALTIPYDPSCTNGTGWRYDAESSATNRSMRGDCDVVKAKPGRWTSSSAARQR